ncbi:MAG: hypothetical protein ACXAEU_12305 [Candidatus Hodarchaeales archaeon]
MEPELLPAINVELESLEDLVRQVVANLTPDHQPLAYYLEKDGMGYLGTFFTVPAYYEYRGLPIFAFVQTEENLYQKEDFLRFDTRKERGKNLTCVNSINEVDLSTGYIQYIPVVKVKGKMAFVRL